MFITRPCGFLLRAAWSLLLAAVCLPAQAQRDAYGGWLKLKGHQTGFFHAERIAGRWWLVTPEGNAFFAKGVGGIDYGPDANASPEEAKNLAGRLKGWNFNAVQTRAGLLPGMAYTVILGLAASTQRDLWLLGIVPDYFSPAFREGVERRAAELCPKLANDPWLLGYFTDNEVRWFPDIRSKDTVLETFLKKPPGSPGYRKAMEFIKERGHTPENITWEDKAGFIEVAAAQYGKICQDAIRRHDRNHMILGSRFNERAPIPLSRAIGPYFDLISFNTYEHRAPLYKLREMSRITGKPVMVTEFSFKAMDSGLPNTIGAGEPVATQEDRADLFAAYAEDLARLPVCVGYFWFKYRDQPKEGQGGRSPGGWGGENSNYGLVRLDGTAWTVLTNRMTAVNAGIEELASEHTGPLSGNRVSQRIMRLSPFSPEGNPPRGCSVLLARRPDPFLTMLSRRLALHGRTDRTWNATCLPSGCASSSSYKSNSNNSKSSNRSRASQVLSHGTYEETE